MDHIGQARALRGYLATLGLELKHQQALEAVAQMHGARNWNVLSAQETEFTTVPLTEAARIAALAGFEKVEALFDLITRAEAYEFSDSPLLTEITIANEPTGDPDEEVLFFVWDDPEEGTFTESVTAADLETATFTGKFIKFQDNRKLVLYRMYPLLTELAEANSAVEATPCVQGSIQFNAPTVSSTCWAIDMCRLAKIDLVEAQEEEIKGRWDWLDRHGNASDCSLETEEAAAEDAIETLYPKDDWKYEVENGDTRLGYQDWVESKIHSDLDDDA